jgi:O-antigen ligase
MNTQSLPQNHRIVDDPHNNTSFLALLGVCLILLGFLLSQIASPELAFGIIGILFACIFVPNAWPLGALAVLMMASVMPRITMDIGGWNARPEHFAAFLVLIVFLLRWMLHKSPRISLTAPDYIVVAYVVWNYISSAWMSPDPKLTLRWALLNNLAVLPYFLIRFLVTDERTLYKVFRAFLAVGIAECAFAIVVFASRQLFGTVFGVEVNQYAGGFGGTYGTQYEPNLMGSFAACLCIIFLVFYFMSQHKPRWLVGGLAISVAALLVSLSRAAFLAFAVTSIVLLFVGARTGFVNARKLIPLGLVLVLFVAPIAATGGRNLASRFLTMSQEGLENDSEAMGRIVAITAALENIAQHPLVGNGTSSFQLLADSKEIPILGERPWVGNSPIRILHDTGVIGLILMGALVVAIAKNVRKVIARQSQARDIVCALAAGCLIYAITFMATEGTMLSFFWIHIGLLATACVQAAQANA